MELTEVLLRADAFGSGDDPIEATCNLPLPLVQKGYSIEVWIDYSQDEEPTASGLSSGGESMWLEIKDVILTAFAPERIEVWISTDGHSEADFRRAMLAADRNEQP